MIDELFVDYDGIDDTILNLINNNDINFNDVPIRSERSIWYELYSELISSQTRFDISRKSILPEFNLRNVSFDNSREELKKRYLFLAKNYLYILAPLVRSEDELSYLAKSYDSKYEKKDFNEKYNLHLMSDIYLSVLLEKFLFDDKPLEDSEFYKKLLELKENPKYLELVKEGLVLMQNGDLLHRIDNVDSGMKELLQRVKSYIEGQEDSLNKKRKLCVLEEYFNILRYCNIDKDSRQEQKLDIIPKHDVVPVKSKVIGYTDYIKSFNV